MDPTNLTNMYRTMQWAVMATMLICISVICTIVGSVQMISIVALDVVQSYLELIISTNYESVPFFIALIIKLQFYSPFVLCKIALAITRKMFFYTHLVTYLLHPAKRRILPSIFTNKYPQSVGGF